MRKIDDTPITPKTHEEIKKLMNEKDEEVKKIINNIRIDLMKFFIWKELSKTSIQQSDNIN